MQYTMKRASTPLAATLTVGLVAATTAAPASSSDCPNAMAEIDQRLAAAPMLDAKILEQVVTLRAEGDAQHRQGRHDAAMAALNEATELLDRQAAAQRFRQPEPSDGSLGSAPDSVFPTQP